MLEFGALRQVLVQIEKLLEVELVDRQHVQLAGRQAADVERLLDAPPVVLVGGELLDDAACARVTATATAGRMKIVVVLYYYIVLVSRAHVYSV